MSAGEISMTLTKRVYVLYWEFGLGKIAWSLKRGHTY